MQLPEWVRTMFLVATGDGWPEADEDGLRALAREWSGVAEAITVLEQRLDAPVRLGRRGGGWDGPAAEAFTAAGSQLSGQSSQQVTALAQGSRELSTFIEDTSANVEYMKLIVLGQLVILAAQIAYLASMAWATFGASTAAIPALQTAGRAFAVTAVRQLLVSIAVGQALQVGLDASIQALQKFVLHTRRDWNTDLTKSAAITGAVGGALGPAMGALGSMATKAIMPMVGKKIAGAVEQITVSAVHEYSTAVGTSMVMGHGPKGSVYDLSAGATDGATDAAGKLMRRGRGGANIAAPDITIAVPTTGHSTTGSTATPVDTGRGQSQPPVTGTPPANSPNTQPSGDSPNSPPATTPTTGQQTTKLTGEQTTALANGATTGETGFGTGDQPSSGSDTAATMDNRAGTISADGTVTTATSLPATPTAEPGTTPSVISSAFAGSTSSVSTGPTPRRRTSPPVTPDTTATITDPDPATSTAEVVDSTLSTQTPTRRAQRLRQTTQQGPEAAVSGIGEEVTVSAREEVTVSAREEMPEYDLRIPWVSDRDGEGLVSEAEHLDDVASAVQALPVAEPQEDTGTLVTRLADLRQQIAELEADLGDAYDGRFDAQYADELAREGQDVFYDIQRLTARISEIERRLQELDTAVVPSGTDIDGPGPRESLQQELGLHQDQLAAAGRRNVEIQYELHRVSLRVERSDLQGEAQLVNDALIALGVPTAAVASAQPHAPAETSAAGAVNSGVADTSALNQASVLPILLADPGQPSPDDSRSAPLRYQETGIPIDLWKNADMARRARLIFKAAQVLQDRSAENQKAGRRQTSWLQLLDSSQQSGHKLHIAAENISDVRNALRRVAPVLVSAGLSVKVALREDVLWGTGGRGLTIYLPRRATIHRDTSLVAAALAGYRTSVAELAGETHLAPGLFHRFEFGWDPGADISMTDSEDYKWYSQVLYVKRSVEAPGANRLTPEQTRASQARDRQKYRLGDNDLKEIAGLIGRKNQPARALEIAVLYSTVHDRPDPGVAWDRQKLVDLRRVTDWVRTAFPQTDLPGVSLTARDLESVVSQVVRPGADLTSDSVAELAALVRKHPRASAKDLEMYVRRDAEAAFRNVAVAENVRFSALKQAMSSPGSSLTTGYTYNDTDLKALASLIVDRYADPRHDSHSIRFDLNEYRPLVLEVLGKSEATTQDLAALADLVNRVRAGQLTSVPDRAVTVRNLRKATAEWPLQSAHQVRLYAEPIEIEMRTLIQQMYSRLAGDAIEQTQRPAARAELLQTMNDFYAARARLDTSNPDDGAPLLTEMATAVQRLQDLLAGKPASAPQVVKRVHRNEVPGLMVVTEYVEASEVGRMQIIGPNVAPSPQVADPVVAEQAAGLVATEQAAVDPAEALRARLMASDLRSPFVWRSDSETSNAHSGDVESQNGSSAWGDSDSEYGSDGSAVHQAAVSELDVPTRGTGPDDGDSPSTAVQEAQRNADSAREDLKDYRQLLSEVDRAGSTPDGLPRLGTHWARRLRELETGLRAAERQLWLAMARESALEASSEADAAFAVLRSPVLPEVTRLASGIAAARSRVDSNADENLSSTQDTWNRVKGYADFMESSFDRAFYTLDEAAVRGELSAALETMRDAVRGMGELDVSVPGLAAPRPRAAVRYEQDYTALREQLGALAVTEADLRTMAMDLTLVGGDAYVEQTLGDPVVQEQLGRIGRALADRPEVMQDGVQSAVNLLLFSAALTPEAGARISAVPVVTGDRLTAVLRGVADDLSAGRDPMMTAADSISPLGSIGYNPSRSADERLARLALLNLAPRDRAALADDPLFNRLMDSGLAADALHAVASVDEHGFLPADQAVTADQVVRSQVPTIAGLLVVGRRFAAQIDEQVPAMHAADIPQWRGLLLGRHTVRTMANQYVETARQEFDAIEQAASAVVERFARGGGRAVAREALITLTGRWSTAMRKLSALSVLEASDAVYAAEGTSSVPAVDPSPRIGDSSRFFDIDLGNQLLDVQLRLELWRTNSGRVSERSWGDSSSEGEASTAEQLSRLVDSADATWTEMVEAVRQMSPEHQRDAIVWLNNRRLEKQQRVNELTQQLGQRAEGLFDAAYEVDLTQRIDRLQTKIARAQEALDRTERTHPSLTDSGPTLIGHSIPTWGPYAPASSLETNVQIMKSRLGPRLHSLEQLLNNANQESLDVPLRRELARERSVDQALSGAVRLLLDERMHELLYAVDVDVIVEAVNTLPTAERGRAIDTLGARRRELHERMIQLEREVDPDTERDLAGDYSRFQWLHQELTRVEEAQLSQFVREVETQEILRELETIRPRVERALVLRTEADVVELVLNNLAQPNLSVRGLTFVRMKPGRDSLWNSVIVAADKQIRTRLGSDYLGPRTLGVTLHPDVVRQFIADRSQSHASAELVARVRSGDVGTETGSVVELVASELGLSLTVMESHQDIVVGPENGHPAYLVREGDDFSAAIPDGTIDELDREFAAHRERLVGLSQFTDLDEQVREGREHLVGATGVVSGHELIEQQGLLRYMNALEAVGPFGPTVENQTQEMAGLHAEFDALVARLDNEGRQGRLRDQAADLKRQFDDALAQSNGEPESAAFGQTDRVMRRMRRMVTALRTAELAATEQATSAQATPTVADQAGSRRNGEIRSDGRRRVQWKQDGVEAPEVARVRIIEPDVIDPDVVGPAVAAAPSPGRLSIADRLRGLAAGAVPVPDQQLFGLPGRTELGRAWRGRTTAQPPELEQEQEFIATGYSADALTKEQAAALRQGQVISLGHDASVVPRQADLPADSPVVVQIDGHVTATSMGVVVRPGHQYDVVSVRQETQGQAFVQLREREA